MIIKDVKRDGNCLLWAIMVAYLEQVKTNEEEFKRRYLLLFGKEKGWKRIFNFTRFDFADQQNQTLVHLFRTRICDYIEKNLDRKRPINKANFRSMLLDSEINHKNKKIKRNLSEKAQIKATLTTMRKNGEITGSVEIEAVCNILNCIIIRSNETFEITNNEVFKPDYIIADSKIRLYYQGCHYRYFSDIDNQRLSLVDNETLSKKNDKSMVLDGQLNDDFLTKARLEIADQLLDKNIDSDENRNAIIDMFVNDISQAPVHRQDELLTRSIIELKAQDQLLLNPNLTFDALIKLVVNESQASANHLAKKVISKTNTN